MTISCITSAISFSITARIIVTKVQLCDCFRSLKSNKTVHKTLIVAQKFKKNIRNINLIVFVRKFLIKTILTRFVFMQNFDFILTNKIHQNVILNI